MLKLTIDDDGTCAKTDIESLFKQIRVSGTPAEKEVIEKIEQGKFNDSQSFIDRFGFKLYMSELSTGCKAALCVLNLPDKQLVLHKYVCG